MEEFVERVLKDKDLASLIVLEKIASHSNSIKQFNSFLDQNKCLCLDADVLRNLFNLQERFKEKKFCIVKIERALRLPDDCLTFDFEVIYIYFYFKVYF